MRHARLSGWQRPKRVGSNFAWGADLCTGQSHDHVCALNSHFDGLEPTVGIAGVTAGSNVELVSVPRTYHVNFRLGELNALARTVVSNFLLHLGDDHALAGRTTHVWADILIGEKLAAELEHAEFKSVGFDQLAARVGKALN
jgi:hypothetical protein